MQFILTGDHLDVREAHGHVNRVMPPTGST
jgi:hypothetical protein